MNSEYQVTYIGSCNEDWNGEVNQRVMELFAEIHALSGDQSFPKGRATLNEDTLLELFDETKQPDRLFFMLRKGQDYIFDKNKLNDALPPVIAKQPFQLGAALRRPGGGATNCAYDTATLYASMDVEPNIRLVVLEASQFCRNVFRDEIRRRDGSEVVEVLPVRKDGISFSNVNLAINVHQNGQREKFDFTTMERRFKSKEIGSLEKILNTVSSTPQMYVVNSVKDTEYSSAIEGYLSRQRSKRRLVIAATDSMLKNNYDSTFSMMGRSDIYVSNIEEIYKILEGHKGKPGLESWKDIGNWLGLLDEADSIEGVKRKTPNKRLIDGIRYIQGEQQRVNKRKGRVYITCGEYGAVAADEENVYFQETHIKAVMKARYLNGAGDSFTGIMVGLEALKSNQPIDQILAYAVAGSQLEVRITGANSLGTLKKDNMENELKEQRGGIMRYEEGRGFQPCYSEITILGVPDMCQLR